MKNDSFPPAWIIVFIVFVLIVSIIYVSTTNEEKCQKYTNEHAYIKNERGNMKPLCYSTITINGEEINITDGE